MKTETHFSWNLFHRTPVVGIIRGIPIDVVRRIAQAYLEAEFYTLEVTMNTEGASDIIAALRNEFPNLNVGAGTVCTLADLNNALNAGAQFVVTPILDEEVVKSTVAQGVPIFPGTFSPTEIFKAWSLGASAVKIFPATQFGVPYIKDISAPLNKIKLLPTGGVSLENIRSFFEAGAFGVGMGGSLLHKKYIEEEDYDGLRNHFVKIKNEIKGFTNS